MLNPERLLRLFIEVVFLLLGVLVGWLGLSNHIFFNSRTNAWIVVSLAMILWGLRALWKPSKSWSPGESWTRGISLTLLGVLMLAISRVPLMWVGPLLALAGGLLVMRGIAGSVLVWRPR